MKKIILIIIFLLFLSSYATANSWTQKMIGVAPEWKTPLYFQDSGVPGLTVLFVGGIHGSETAGVVALEELIASINIQRGRILILPAANPPAIKVNRRNAPGETDLNRAFHGDSPQSLTEMQAAEIYQILLDYEVDLVFDLHESVEFYRLSDNHVGQTIIFNSDNDDYIFLAYDIVAMINPYLEGVQEFSVLSPTKRHSLTNFAFQDLGLTTFITETTRKNPLTERVMQKKMIVFSALYLLDLIDSKPDLLDLK